MDQPGTYSLGKVPSPRYFWYIRQDKEARDRNGQRYDSINDEKPPGVSMFLQYTERFLTIATLSSPPYHQDDRQLPLSNLRTSFQWHCSCGKCNSFWRAHPFDTRTQLRTAFPGKKHFLLNRQGTERHIFGWQYYSERDTL